jgi:glutaconate CoA-transferase subunit A
MARFMTLPEAIEEVLHDGQSVALEGFTHLIPFAAGHEIMRQGKKDLTLCRLTPDLIYDQMVAAGVAKKLVLAGEIPSGLCAIRRAVERRARIEYSLRTRHSHQGRASGFPSCRSAPITGRISKVNGSSPSVPFHRGSPLRRSRSEPRSRHPPPNVRRLGNTGVGLTGSEEAAFAAKVIVVVEEIVEEEAIRADPNRTMIPGVIVSAVVEEPYGAHPSFVQGYYDRDNDFYVAWEDIGKTEEGMKKYLDEWVYGVEGRKEYVEKLGRSVRGHPPRHSFRRGDYGLYR